MHARYTNTKKDYIRLKNQNVSSMPIMVGGRIENNNICKFEYIGNDPTEQEVIISCSIFKLGSMYKDITVYVNGLRRLIEYVCNPTTSLNLHMILHYDHSVEQDQMFLDLKSLALANNKKIQLCKYYCSNFIDTTSELHRGIFGMFVRFYPLFEKKYEKNLKFISDIDFNDREIMFYCKYIPEKTLDNDNFFFCIQKIGYEWRYANFFRNEYLSGMCLAVIYMKNKSLPVKLLEDCLEQLKNNDPILLDLMRKVQQARLSSEEDKQKLKEVTTFTYGFDEWFINNHVINYAFENYGRIGVIYMSDNLVIYPKQMINWKKMNEKTKTLFYKTVLENKATNNNDVNAKNLSRMMSPFIVTIDDYEKSMTIVDKFYNTVKEFIKDDKLELTYNDWMKNLKKHVESHYLVNFFYLNNMNNTEQKNEKLFIYLCENMQFKTVTIDDSRSKIF